MTINNPNPLIIHVGDHGAKGKVTAADHYDKIKQSIIDLKKVDPAIEIVGLATDNENTMKGVRALYREDGGVAVGCGSHGGNKALGTFVHALCIFHTSLHVHTQKNIARWMQIKRFCRKWMVLSTMLIIPN